MPTALRWSTFARAITLVVAGGVFPPPLVSAQAVPPPSGQVMTVRGPVSPALLGHTLMHEHLLMDRTIPDEAPERWRAAGRARPAGATESALYHAPLALDNLSRIALGAMNRDNWLLTNRTQQTKEIGEFKRVGGGTIVDVTPFGMGRDPAGLRDLAERSGLLVVMGTGWYRSGWYPDGLEERSVERLTEELVHDLTVGVDSSGIRAGIIGEVWTSDHPERGVENRLLQAAGRASKATGAAITLHVMNRQHGQILDILIAAGADPSRIILGHADLFAKDIPYLTTLIARGATIEFDLLGRAPLVTRTRPLDSEVATAVATLVKAGLGDHILLSQDIAEKISLKSYGGTGYSFIEEQFLPYLKRQGVTDDQINQIMVATPARLLTLASTPLGQ